MGAGGRRRAVTFLQRLEYLPQLVFSLARCQAAGGNGDDVRIDGVEICTRSEFRGVGRHLTAGEVASDPPEL